MNYKKMWYQLKARAITNSRNTKRTPEERKFFDEMMKMMADVEVEAADKEEYCCCGCSEEIPFFPKDEADPEDTKEERQEKEKTGKDILKDIFGKDFVDNLEDLKAKLNEDGVKVILVDADLKIPEELEKEAKEKKIALGRAQCGAFKVGSDGPFPMPFPFPLGFLK